MILLILKLYFLINLINYGRCAVTIRAIPQVYIGNNVTIYCDLVDEGAVAWRRYPYTDPNNITILQAPRLPARYNIITDVINTTYTVSRLIITGVVVEDFSTFECSSFLRDKKDLIEAPPTTTTTSTTTTTTAPTTQDPLTLCQNGSYNHVLFALLLISKISLGILLIGFMKFLRPSSAADILVTFGCVVASIGFIIIMMIFWISPAYVSSYPSNQYWSPIVIVPSSIVGFLVLWGGIFYFIIRAFLNKNFIKIPELVIIIVIAFCQLFLLTVILCSVVYCTGRSAFSPLTTDYSVVSDICAGLLVASCFAFIIYFFWIFREQLTSIEITPSEKKKRPIPDIRTSSSNISKSTSKSNDNIIKITQERRPSITISSEREVFNSVRTDKNYKLDFKDGLSSNRSNPAFKSFYSELKSNELLSPRVESETFKNRVRKSRDNLQDDLFVPSLEPATSRVNLENQEEPKSSIVNILRRNSIVNVAKSDETRDFKSDFESSKDDGIEEIQTDVLKQKKVVKKKKVKKIESEEKTQDEEEAKTKKKKVKKIESEEKTQDEEDTKNKKKKTVKKKDSEDGAKDDLKEEGAQQPDVKKKKVKKVKKTDTIETF